MPQACWGSRALLPCDLPRVLLIDELDKSDIDLPKDLLSGGCGANPRAKQSEPPCPGRPHAPQGTGRQSLHRPTIRAPRPGACPNPEGESFVSKLALLVALLLVVVVVLLAAGAAYVVHHHPAWAQPIGIAFGAVMLMATLIALILAL